MSSMLSAFVLMGVALAPLHAQRLPPVPVPERRIVYAPRERTDQVFVETPLTIQRDDSNAADAARTPWASSDSVVAAAVALHCRVLGYRAAAFAGDTAAALTVSSASPRQYRTWLCRLPVDTLTDRSRGRVIMRQIRLSVVNASAMETFVGISAVASGVDESEDSEMTWMHVRYASGATQPWRLLGFSRALRR